MKLFKKLISKEKSGFSIRYSKEQNKWEVYWETSLIYIGEKDACKEFLENSKKNVLNIS